MFLTRQRRVAIEWLDGLSDAHPEAARSRRDLRRINRVMRSAALAAAALGGLGWPGSGTTGGNAIQVADLGGGDGTLLCRIARRLPRSSDRVTAWIVDPRAAIDPGTRHHLHHLGWDAESHRVDARRWLESSPQPLDFLITNLFLHHFPNDTLIELLGAVAQRASCVVALEPRRSLCAGMASRLLLFLGCNRVTRHDAPISVAAGFRDGELTRMWPDRRRWEIVERRAGPFSHLFTARRSACTR